MTTESSSAFELEIAHVLFIDIVGYSKLLTDRQRELLNKLNTIVRETDQFKSAEAAGKLVRLPTGDGMALAFFTNPEAPLKCAIEISQSVKNELELGLRMGIHSGPVSGVTDVNDRSNVAGIGINMAQRVMDCGDAGHILLSKRAADDLAQYGRWRSQLHELGQVEVKHGVKVGIVNFHTDNIGNAALPEKIASKRKEQARVSKSEQARARAKRRGLELILLLAAILIIGLSIFAYRASRKTITATAPSIADKIPEKSIAVLPLENLSEDKENAYFAGGVQDEILSNLAKIADLKVISRTSVMKYNTGPERNLREIAKTLGVSYVVEGSVQRVGERVRVNAQLIDARNDAHVWAEHYDRDFADIFAIQSDIAQRIADQLRAKLSPAEKAAITEQPTGDLVAYAYYTKAKELDQEVDWEGAEKSLNRKVELLEKATRRDPNFALAYCELAKTQIDLSSMVAEPENRFHIELAKKAAETALRARPDLGEAHLELARYYFYSGVYSNNYDRAREELAIVRRKLPNNAEALTVEGRIGRHENRWDASLANLQKANELDPRNSDIGFYLFQIYSEMRLYHEGEQLLAKRAATGTIDPLAVQGHLADLKLSEGDPVAAQSLLDQLPLDYSPGPWIWNLRFRAALYLRDYNAASRVIAATPEKWNDVTFNEQTLSWAEAQVAQVARARGDKQKALEAVATARKKLEALNDEANDAGYLSEVATLDAGLGKKEDAIREARRAVELQPIATDSLNGAANVTRLALVYAWTGERDQALEQLQIVAKVPNGPTYGDLKFNPCWDSLRGDPRFEKIIASLAPKDVK